VSGVKSFFSNSIDAAKETYSRITGSDREELKEAETAEDKAEVIDRLADETYNTEDAADLETIADMVAEGEAVLSPSYGVDDKGEAIDEFYEKYGMSDENWPELDASALDDGERYHMEITYTAILNDGTVIERTIERYNFHDEDIINGMIWEDLFHQGDDDGNDVDTGDVASMSASVSYR
jgi:hypothetical protein